MSTPYSRPVITPYVRYFKSLQNISLDSVLKAKPIFNLLPGKAVIYQGYDPYYYWFRFVISNKDTVPKQLMLLMGPLGMRDANLYQQEESGWKWVARTGNQYRFQERPYQYTHYVLPLTVRASRTDTFYMSLDEKGNFKTFAFALMHPKALKRLENRTYLLFGITIGFLLLFALFNLYLLFTIKEIIHCWYSLYIFTLIFLLMKNEGLDEQFLHLDSETGYRLTPIMGVGALTIVLLMHVVQLFLVNIRRRSSLYRITSGVKFLILFFALLHFTSFYLQPGYKTAYFVFQMVDKATILGVVLILINCIDSYRRGFAPAIYILAGVIVFLIGSLERLLTFSTPTYLFPPSIFQIGMVLETVIISFALLYRYNLFKKEKEDLEKKLEIKTSEAAKEILFTQEQEQKRIALDLHDELGGNLAALKMTMQTFDMTNHQMEIATQLIDNTTENARRIAHNLMPPGFEESPLEDLLSKYYSQLSVNKNLNISFLTSGGNRQFDKQQQLMIYRIFLELTTNAMKHANASDITVQLIYCADYAQLVVEDNGNGFAAHEQNGSGMRNVKSRVNFLKGTLDIDSGQKGTTVLIKIPYQ